MFDKTRITETPGWVFAIRRHDEQRKIFISDGRVFVGTYKESLMEKGVMSELTNGGMRLRYNVTFDADRDIKK